MINDYRPEHRRAAASEYLHKCWRLHYTPATLANLAITGKGAVYHMRGRFAFYREEDLDAWAQAKISGPKRKASGTPCRKVRRRLTVHDVGYSVRQDPVTREIIVETAGEGGTTIRMSLADALRRIRRETPPDTVPTPEEAVG